MVDGDNETHCGDRLVTYIKIESLWCIPETNTVLYVSYTSIKQIFYLAPPGLEMFLASIFKLVYFTALSHSFDLGIKGKTPAGAEPDIFSQYQHFVLAVSVPVSQTPLHCFYVQRLGRLQITRRVISAFCSTSACKFCFYSAARETHGNQPAASVPEKNVTRLSSFCLGGSTLSALRGAVLARTVTSLGFLSCKVTLAPSCAATFHLQIGSN